MTSVVLGLNGANGLGHDAAAALVVANRLVMAVEEERLSRSRRAYGLPPLRSMVEVLKAVGVGSDDIDTVAYPWLPSAMGVPARDVDQDLRGWFRETGLPLSPKAKIRFIEHHVAHAWSGLAFVPGGVSGRRIAVLVLDGSGESTSGAAYIYDGALKRQWNLSQSSSVGIYYEAITQYLGFGWGEEGKAMGLASYGRDMDLPVPGLPDERFSGSLPLYRRKVETPRDIHVAVRQKFLDEFRRIHGHHLSFNDKADVAFAGQRVAIRRILEYAEELLKQADVLVMSGGVALNCSANAEVAVYCRQMGADLVIPPPASDAGVAIGAAIASCDDPAGVEALSDAYLGRGYSSDEIGRELRRQGLEVIPSDTRALAAKLVEHSLICGWFEGRSEIGPRALGKRAIISRPDSVKVRDRLNFLKGRESWRPLAPSVTQAEFDRTFAGSIPSPYMLIGATALPGASTRLAGAIHVDGSSRPQLVTSPGPYRDLLLAMGAACDAEAVICTSFNAAGDPMVYSPADAVTSARLMGLDLIAGDAWCSYIGHS